ncbi:RHS repeat-associated core domain-containing protein [Streptomyces sp. NPDC001728]|uniref:RHS repeat-associated core domain-containing protein n=1 Tax=Streptomyces sp. NPDC001728 TaxID=3154396 RepID=UPI003319F5FE
MTGEMTLPQTDLSLPGVLPLVLRRTHLSEYRHGQWFGRSWASSLDERLELDPLGTGAVWAREDGSLLVYPELPRPGGEPVLPVEGDRLPLVHGGQHEDETVYTVSDPHSSLTRTFTGSPYLSSIGYWLAEIRDRNDNRVVFSRRPDGSPTAVTHTGGYTVQVSSEAQRVTGLALRGPEGPVTLLTYGYDERGNLDAVTNSSGLALRFGYDEDDRITSWTDRNDSTFRYAYDDAGRVVRTIGPDGFLSSTFTYDPESRVTRYTDSTGATTVHHFNEHLQVVATTDPLGNTVHQSWDRHDNLLSRTDALGHTTRLDWDERGNLTAVRNPDGTALSCVYNDLDLPLTTVLPDGVELRQEYDARGNRIRSTDEHGATTTFVYDGSGAPVAVTDTLGHTTTFDRDPHGLPLAFTDPLGAVTRYRRDAFGRTVAVEGPLGNTISFEWTTEGLLARRVEADGSGQSWTYDGEGNCLTHTDALGGVARFTYTHFDLMRSRTAPDGVRHEFVHDTERRLTQVVNPQGMTWNYSYDAAGRLAGETDFDGRSVGYTYDAVGRTTSRTNALGQQVRYEHDALGRILRKDADGQVTAFDYDLCGRLVAATAPGVTLSMTRDEWGRPTAESVNGRTLTHAYDALGRRTSRTTPVGVTSQWAFDAAGNRTRLTTAGRTIDFGYDAAGRETTRDFGGAFTLAHAYDELGRLTTQSVRDAAGRSLHRRDYGYRADHTLTYTDDQHTGRRTFDLDAVGRVTAVHAEGWSERYAYDEAGNQTEADWPRSHPGHEATGARSYTGTRVEHAGRVRYEHDGQGRVTLRRKAHLSGKVESWRYTWDAEDRLVGAVTPDGTRWRYLYDPFGRRVAKQRLDDADEVVERTDFAWDGLLLCEQVTTSAELPRPVALTWDHQGTRPVAQTEHLAGQDEVDRRFFAIVTDLVGTPRELLDENGETAWRTRTTLWGTTTWAADSVAYTPLRFPGQYFDPETGLNYNHFRHYDPEVARYLTSDPLGLAPAANPFTYVHNPHTWTDHLGLAPECPTFPIYRTPKHKDKEYEKEHGPNPANHQPGVDMGGGYLTDGKIYFGERDVAAEYWSPNGGVNFANGMVRYDMHPDFLKEFTSSDYMKVYDTKGKDGAPRIEWTIPVDKLDRFNELVMKRTWIPYGEKG